MLTPPSVFAWLVPLLLASACSFKSGGGSMEASGPDAPADQPGGRVGDGPETTTWASGEPASVDGADGSVPVPEPTTILLVGSGLVAIARWRRRRPQAV